jgi:hypothetical protein
MSYIRTQNGVVMRVTDMFIESCGLLKGMEELLGSSTEADPIPLEALTDDIFCEVLRFFNEAPVVAGPLTMDNYPDYEFFINMPAPRIVDLWKAADFLDYNYMQTFCALQLALMLQYCEPSRAMAMFNITEPPSDDDINECLRRHPFLREI